MSVYFVIHFMLADALLFFLISYTNKQFVTPILANFVFHGINLYQLASVYVTTNDIIFKIIVLENMTEFLSICEELHFDVSVYF